MHGITLYRDIFVNFSRVVLDSQNLLTLPKVQAQTYVELFEKANKEISSLLMQNVPTFNQSEIAKLPTSEPINILPIM